MKTLILESEDFSSKALKALRAVSQVTLGLPDGMDLLQFLLDINILVIRLGYFIDKKLLSSPNLRYILTPTTGLDHIDLKAAELNGVQIISLTNEITFLSTIPSTAEHTWALLLSLLRKVPAAHTDVLNGIWHRDKFKSRNLNQLRLGILGYGRVGKQIGRFADAFGMEYIFHDINEDLSSDPHSTNDKLGFYGTIDILCLHIPLNEETRNLIDLDILKLMKLGALIINTSRGAIVNEQNIVESLIGGSLGGYATDVLSDEFTDNVLENCLVKYAVDHDNMIITPHIAGATIDSMHMTEEFVVDKLVKIINL